MAQDSQDRTIVPVDKPNTEQRTENPILAYAKKHPVITLGVIVLLVFLIWYFFMRGDGSQTNIKVDSVLDD